MHSLMNIGRALSRLPLILKDKAELNGKLLDKAIKKDKIIENNLENY